MQISFQKGTQPSWNITKIPGGCGEGGGQAPGMEIPAMGSLKPRWPTAGGGGGCVAIFRNYTCLENAGYGTTSFQDEYMFLISMNKRPRSNKCPS